MAKSDALAFAAGFGGGYLSQTERDKREAEREEERGMRRSEHDARMKREQREEDDRAALADAAKPVPLEDVPGGMVKPDSMDNRDVGLPENATMPNGGLQQANFRVGKQTFTDRGQAEAAAAKENTPQATDARIAGALRSRGNVVGAKQYEASSRQAEVSAMDLADRVWQRKVRGAIGQGHEGLAALVSESQGGDLQTHQLRAVPSADGKQVTYARVGEDGTVTPIPHLTFTNDQEGVILAGYMLDRSVTPETRYKNMVAEDKLTATVTAKEKELELRERELKEVKIPNAETRAKLAEVSAQLAELRAQRANAARGTDALGREERLRYTTLFTDAGRRMQDAQKALNTMRQDRSFMRRAGDANTPEGQQLAEVQAQLRTHTEERELYRGLLAERGSGSGGKSEGGAAAPAAGAGLAGARAPGAPSKKDQAAAKAAVKKAPTTDYSNLWK